MRRHLGLPPTVKRITNPIVGRIPIKIISGVNRGAWWSLAAAGSGYGSGQREAEQMRLLWSLMRPGDVVWDVGAHYGFVTIAAAKRVGARGAVHAFEPSQSNRWFLKRHIRWNRHANVRVHDFAVGGCDGTSSFGGGRTSKQHQLGAGSETVIVRTIPSILAAGASAPPTFLKIDIEGAEADMLEAGLHALPPATRMLVAVHTAGVYERCAAALRAAGYRMTESERLQHHRRHGFDTDADLYACGPAWTGTEETWPAP